MLNKYLDNKFLTLFLIPILLGISTVLSFQPFNFTVINFLVLPIFFYLIIYINKKSKSIYRKRPYKKNLFLFGTSFGFGYYLSGLHWITHSLTFDDSFVFLIPFALILIPLFLSLFYSLVTLTIGPMLNFIFASIFLFSGSLAFADYVRAKILTGFPWNLWVYSFSQHLEVIQILNEIGLFALNIAVVTLFMIPTVLFFKIRLSKKLLTIMIIPLIIFIFYIYGNHAINGNKKKIKFEELGLNVKVISPNFDLEYGLEYKKIKLRLEKLIRYSEPEPNLPTLFVWPEGVFSGYNYKEIYKLKNIFLNNFDKEHYVLFGVNKLDEKGIFNSLIIVNNQMEIIQEYNKQKLVPFGEFLPLENILSKFGLKKVTEGHGSFLKGTKYKNLKVDKFNILPLICYEIIFPEFTQKADHETNLIVNISEDGWFGNSIGPHQHFAKAIFRAIENNTYLLRSANKGISAIINNKGQIIKKLDTNEAGNIEIKVPLIKNRNKNKNDLKFFALLITYIFIFKLSKRNYGE